MYADVARPLYALHIVFEWMDEYEQALQKFKNALVFTPILKVLDWSKIFHVYIDASTYAIGTS